MRVIEKVLVRLDATPWAQLCRAAIGFAFLPLLFRLAGDDVSVWGGYAFLLVTLCAFRVVPLIIRRVVPFSAAVKVVWSERRHLAKTRDSYQWQKLFWIGLGLLANLVASGKPVRVAVVLTATCLVAGGLGLGLWLSSRHETGQTSAQIQIG